MAITLYETLEVSRHASPEVIRAAYKALIHKYHPDKHSDGSTTEKCFKINNAYDTLSDPEKKKNYDSTIDHTTHQAPTYKSYTPPQPFQQPPPPPRPKPVYTYDPKWENFLNGRADWARHITPPVDSWCNTDTPVCKLVGGFTDIRPDLELWGQWIIRTGQQTSKPYSAIEAELVKTWSYFIKDSGSLMNSLVKDAARELCNKAQHITNNKVQFGI